MMPTYPSFSQQIQRPVDACDILFPKLVAFHGEIRDLTSRWEPLIMQSVGNPPWSDTEAIKAIDQYRMFRRVKMITQLLCDLFTRTVQECSEYHMDDKFVKALGAYCVPITSCRQVFDAKERAFFHLDKLAERVQFLQKSMDQSRRRAATCLNTLLSHTPPYNASSGIWDSIRTTAVSFVQKPYLDRAIETRESMFVTAPDASATECCEQRLKGLTALVQFLNPPPTNETAPPFRTPEELKVLAKNLQPPDTWVADQPAITTDRDLEEVTQPPSTTEEEYQRLENLIQRMQKLCALITTMDL